jgi:hypothetical protein
LRLSDSGIIIISTLLEDCLDRKFQPNSIMVQVRAFDKGYKLSLYM